MSEPQNPEAGMLAELERLRAQAAELQRRHAQLQKADEAHHVAEMRLRQIIDLVPHMIFAKDHEGRFLLANRAVAEAYGVTVDELIGRSHRELHERAEEIDRMLADDRAVIETGARRFIPAETFTDRHGERRVLQTTKIPFTEPGSNLPAMLGVAVDITDRAQTREALEEERRRAQEYLNIAGVMLVVLERDGAVSLINRKGCEVLGRAEHEILGRNWFDHFVPEAIRGRVRAVFDRLMAGEVELTEYVENPIINARGEQRLIAWHNVALRDREGKLVQTLSSGEDITDRRKAEEQQQQMMRELDHRVKNNLAAVLSIAEQTVSGADSLDAFAEAFTGRVRSMAIAHEMLARSRWEGANLREMLHRLLAPYRDDDDRRFSCEGPPVTLPASVTQSLCMVIHELVTNAVKYGALASPQGRVWIGWEREHPGPSAEQLRLTWLERDGPPVTRPAHRGFGTALIERMIAYQLHGHARLNFDRAGVNCTMLIPLTSRPEPAGMESGSSADEPGEGGS
ncbi:MAG: PAS domain S-box protein [Planctomycetota bacterium]|nr:PAS domain S-box protein [Planctomycetota bacterium]